MTNEEFQASFNYLVKIGWVRLPYGFLPGSRPGGNVDSFSRSRRVGVAIGWNPPQYLAHLPEFTEPDNLGSPKPDWSVLVANVAPAMLGVLRPRALRETPV